MCEKADIKKHYLLTGWESTQVYLLLCYGAPVTVRSQQVRALNLAWALQEDFNGKDVAVIGGGAAGITFAAAAAKLGAKVHLFEASKLMHLQVGCRHRPLHPEIYTWPEPTAFRPVSHLPLLGWTTGSAHDVATELVSKFLVIKEEVGGRLIVKERTAAKVTVDGKVRVNGEQETQNFQIIVLAVGFGVEASAGDFPINPYWRVDALDQSFLGDNRQTTIVVSGAGDGALVEVLRACVEEPEHGALWDQVLALTLQDAPLLDAVREIVESEKQGAKGTDLGTAYSRLKTLSIDKLLLERKRPNTKVHWLVEKVHPFDARTQAFWRFIVSRLMARKDDFNLECAFSATGQYAIPLSRGRSCVLYTHNGENKSLKCDQALLRWGSERVAINNNSAVLASVARVFEDPASLSGALQPFLDPKKDHQQCNQPRGWDSDQPFLAKVKPNYGGRIVPSPPVLMAEFVAGFSAPDAKWPDAPFVYRIRIWLTGLPNRLWVRYDLHPEEGNKPITRVGIGDVYEQWLNTRNDYNIRVRSSDGFEWNVGSVLAALYRHYIAPSQQVFNFPLLEVNGGIEQSPRYAIQQLEKQTQGHR